MGTLSDPEALPRLLAAFTVELPPERSLRIMSDVHPPPGAAPDGEWTVLLSADPPRWTAEARLFASR